MKTEAKIASPSPAPPVKSYRAHRERQRRRILNAAQVLFNDKGIDRVTLAEIIAATGVRPSTVYEYFSNKDQIVWALVEEYFAQSYEYLRERYEQATGPTVIKITAMLEALGDELTEHPERVRFQAQFDAMYAHDWSVELMLAIEDKILPNRLENLAALIREGIADGSLRSDLNPELTMHSVFNAVIATQRRLAALGDRVEQEYRQPIQLLFREAVRIIVSGLRKV
jgi:AcrR family transcriptional regulator